MNNTCKTCGGKVMADQLDKNVLWQMLEDTSTMLEMCCKYKNRQFLGQVLPEIYKMGDNVRRYYSTRGGGGISFYDRFLIAFKYLCDHNYEKEELRNIIIQISNNKINDF